MLYVCVGVHRGALDGTPSPSIYVVVVYGVVIDDGWSRPKWHALHVVLCREAARRCVCGYGVKVKGGGGEWRCECRWIWWSLRLLLDCGSLRGKERRSVS